MSGAERVDEPGTAASLRFLLNMLQQRLPSAKDPPYWIETLNGASALVHVTQSKFCRMLNFSDLLTFSHMHCITICAVLVPLNLLFTLQTLILVGLNRSRGELIWSTGFASLFSGVMVLHVLTWFVVGVVMLPTYVLLMLGSLCLGMNLWAIGNRQSLRSVMYWLGRSLRLA